MALLFAGTLFLTANASLSARPATSLATLRLDYGGPGGLLDDVGGGNNSALLSLINAGLVRILPNGRVAPDLATWTISKNHLVYTFAIRQNARFSNGHSVTAQDAAFSLERVLTPSFGSGALTYLGLIRGAATFNAGKTKTLSGVKVLNPRTLQITITKPAAYALPTLSQNSIVFDPTVVAGKPLGSPKDNFKTNYLGTTCTGNQGAGPFTFVCHDRSSTLHSFYSGHTRKYTLVPNPYYYGRTPSIRLELPNYTNYYISYLADKVDTSGIPPVDLSRWRGKSSQYHEFSSPLIDFLTPNLHMAPFSDLHCRLAVAYAIDREFLADNILGGTARATYAIVPKGMLGYYDGKNNPRYNLTRAKSELAKCPSRTTPFELKFDIESQNTYSAIATMLSAAGMNVRLKPLSGTDWGTVVSQSLDKTNTQLVRVGWSQDYPDPQDYCSLLRSGSQYAVSGWHSGSYDRLVDQADATLDPKKRAQLYIQAQHLALSQGAFISINNFVSWVLIKPYVRGLVGTEAFSYVVPKNGDWSTVSVSKH